VLENYSYSTTTSYSLYSIGVSDQIEVSMPRPTDTASLELGATNFCGDYTEELIVYYGEDQLDAIPGFIVRDTQRDMLVISTDDITDVGYYSIWVSYSVPAYPDIFYLEEILHDVQIIHPCLEDNTFRVTTESSFA